ncbi:putative ribonuclease H-like domain-containing protein [Tanacetum coccineum]
MRNDSKLLSVQQALVTYIHKQNRTNHKDHQNYFLACFLSQEEPKKISQALEDESWVEAMQEELLQFKLQKVWILVDLPPGKKAIGTKWVFRNKKDERGIVVKNKARLVAQGFRQEEGIDYDEVFAPVARIEAIRLFLAFASFMGFPVYQMDIKSAFLYGTIGEEVYVYQPLSFVDPAHPNKVYKVVKALYGLHQAPRAWYETLSTFLLENGFRRGTIDKTLFIKKNKSDIIFQMSSMGECTFFLGLQVKQQPNGIFISQDKYVADILKKFDFCYIRTATTPIESNNGVNTAGGNSSSNQVSSTPGADEVVCSFFAHQATSPPLDNEDLQQIDQDDLEELDIRQQVAMLTVRVQRFVKKTGRNLDFKGKQPVTFDKSKVECYNCHRKGHFAKECKSGRNQGKRSNDDNGRRNATTNEPSSQALVAQDGLGGYDWSNDFDEPVNYSFNFMNTKIYIDNESTICIVKNLVYHSRTKHIEIRHHFIRDCYEKRLIDVVKIHTDNNVADLLTKGFDVTRFNFLVVSIGMLNL